MQDPVSTATSQSVVKVRAGTKIITENELSQKMYVIVKGKARVFKTYLGQRITLAVLGDGEIFGEMSFIDAAPRSASVEALTEMDLIIVDGAKGAEQLKNLPEWVWAIFRTVFYRFRELDREMVSLHSALQYRKKGLKSDVVASTIYLEMLRFLKTIALVQQRRTQAGESMRPEDFLAELDGILGNKAIGLKPFWKMLEEFDFFSLKTGHVAFFEKRMKGLEQYLREELDHERYLMLSHGALSVMRRIITFLKTKDSVEEPGCVVEVTCEEIKVRTIPGFEVALKELESLQLIPFKDGVFTVWPDRAHELYTYHSILKSFDHSAIYID